MSHRRRHEERARAEAERQQTDEPRRGYASPACAMHEVDPAYMGLSEERSRRPRKRKAAKDATVTAPRSGSGS